MNEEGRFWWARLIRAPAQTARASQATAGIGGGCCSAREPPMDPDCRSAPLHPPRFPDWRADQPRRRAPECRSAGNLLCHRVDPRIVIAYRNMPFSAWMVDVAVTSTAGIRCRSQPVWVGECGG